MSPNLFAREDPSESRNIFVLGICVLFGWMIVILICASPHVSLPSCRPKLHFCPFQLFRNYLKKWFKHDEDPLTDKIRKAEARLQETLRLAQKPSNFLVDQAAVMSTMAVRPEKSEVEAGLKFQKRSIMARVVSDCVMSVWNLEKINKAASALHRSM